MTDKKGYLEMTEHSPWRREERQAEGASALGAAFNLGNSMVAGGISVVALPLACQKTGLVLWPILSIFIMLVSCYTSDLLVCCSVETRKASFAALLGHVCGFWGARFMDMVIIINNLSCCVTFLQAFEAVMKRLLQIPSVVWPIGAAAVALGALLTAKSMNSFIPLSQFAAFEVLLFAGLVVSCVSELPEKLPHEKLALWPSSFASFLGGLSITVWSMCVQYNVMPVFAGVRQPDRRKRWVSALALGTGVPLALYLLFGILGYLVHPHTSGDILVDFSRFLSGRVLAVVMAVGLVASFPLIEWEAAHSLVRIIVTVCLPTSDDESASNSDDCPKKDSSEEEASAPAASASDASGLSRKLSTIALPEAGCLPVTAHIVCTIAVTIVAACVKDVSKVIELIGALAAVPMLTVLPPFIYANMDIDSEGCWIYSKSCAKLTFVLGIFVTGACTFNWFAENGIIGI